MVSLFLVLDCNLELSFVDLFAALHQLASASALTLLKLTSSVRTLLKPYGDTLKYAYFPIHFIFYLLLIKLPYLCAKWLLMLKCPEYLRGSSIPLMLWRKLPKKILRFLYSITLSWVSMKSFRLRRQLQRHYFSYLASFQVSVLCARDVDIKEVITKCSDDLQWWKAWYPSTEGSFPRFVN